MGEATWRHHAGPEGWGGHLAPLSRRLLTVILQRDHECGLVDECGPSHTKSPPSLPQDPMHGPSSLLQKETGQDLPLGACQPSSLISPGATQNDWRHSRPPPTNCMARSQSLPPGEPHTRPGQSSLASAWSCKLAISQVPEIFIFIQAALRLFFSTNSSHRR